MTIPRRHLPDQVVTLTRRTVDRRFFCRPDSHINQVVRWELARASLSAGFAVHALMVMSNHPHIVGTDLTGDRSLFMRDFCSGIARARNRELKRRGRFWDNRQFGDTVLLDRNAVERKLLYAWLNPVTANLVRRAEDWPGAKILPRDWGKPQILELPKNGFYRAQKEVMLTFTPMPPPGYEDMTLEQVIEHFETLLREEEDRLSRRRFRARKRVRGRFWILRQATSDCPATSSKMRTLSPRFATTNDALMDRAKDAHTAFQNAYDACRKRWLAGRRDVEFPAGTIQLRLQAPIECRARCPDEVTIFARAA